MFHAFYNYYKLLVKSKFNQAQRNDNTFSTGSIYSSLLVNLTKTNKNYENGNMLQHSSVVRFLCTADHIIADLVGVRVGTLDLGAA